MKKLVQLLSVMAITGAAFAQGIPNADIPKLNINQGTLDMVDAKFTSDPSAMTVSEWYNHARAFEQNVAGALNYSVRFMSFDTNARWVFHDDRLLSIGTQVVGQSFDPKDSTYLGLSPLLSQHNDYMVDSINFLRFYIRNLDSTMVGGSMTEVVDTMVVQYFTTPNNGISRAGLVVTTGINVLAYPNRDNLNYNTLVNSSAVKTIKVPLRTEDADSVTYAGAQSSFIGSLVDLPVGVQVNATGTAATSNNFAYTVHFKPMVPVAEGDTMINISTSAGEIYNKNNMFGVRTGSAEGISQENSTILRYNNAIFTFSWLRFGQTQNGWKSYIGGNAYASAQQWDNFIKITSTSVSSNPLDELSGIKVYPNPSNVGTDANVSFASLSAGAAIVTITDINGRVAQSMTREVSAGNNTIVVPVSNLMAGIYFVNVEANGAKASTKLMISK